MSRPCHIFFQRTMEIIKLTTKPQTLEAIRRGEIKEYTREIRPNTQAKYCELDEEGYVKDIDGVLQPRKYDVAKFSAGYGSYSCKIEKAWIELFEDDNHELVTYMEKGEEYIAAQIVYLLGDEVKV